MRDEGTKNFIGFCRYIVCRPEDVYGIFKAKLDERHARAKLSNDPQEKQTDLFVQGALHGFKGYLTKISRKNEYDTWRYIDKVVDVALDSYQTTLGEDYEIINPSDNQ